MPRRDVPDLPAKLGPRKVRPSPVGRPNEHLATLDDIGLQEGVGDETPYVIEVRDLEAEKAALEILALKENISHRRKYASRIFYFVSTWMIGVFGIIVVDGVGLLDVSDNVLMALIGGTTVNVLGLFAIVANYFFPKK